MTTGQARELRVYERVVAIVWQRLGPTFGQRTIAAIARNALARRAEAHPPLADLRVTEAGLDWAAVQARSGSYEEEALSKALEAFLDEFFDGLSNLIGQLVVQRVFKEATEHAEERQA